MIGKSLIFMNLIQHSDHLYYLTDKIEELFHIEYIDSQVSVNFFSMLSLFTKIYMSTIN